MFFDISAWSKSLWCHSQILLSIDDASLPFKHIDMKRGGRNKINHDGSHPLGVWLEISWFGCNGHRETGMNQMSPGGRVSAWEPPLGMEGTGGDVTAMTGRRISRITDVSGVAPTHLLWLYSQQRDTVMVCWFRSPLILVIILDSRGRFADGRTRSTLRDSVLCRLYGHLSKCCSHSQNSSYDRE